MPNTIQVESIIWSPFFPCGVEAIQAHVPHDSGVYILYTSDQLLLNGYTIPGTPFYVGRAIDLQERLLQHLTDDEPNTILNCRFVFGTADVDKIAGIEKYVFDSLRPTCCLDPGGVPIQLHYLPTAGRAFLN